MELQLIDPLKLTSVYEFILNPPERIKISFKIVK